MNPQQIAAFASRHMLGEDAVTELFGIVGGTAAQEAKIPTAQVVDTPAAVAEDPFIAELKAEREAERRRTQAVQYFAGKAQEYASVGGHVGVNAAEVGRMMAEGAAFAVAQAEQLGFGGDEAREYALRICPPSELYRLAIEEMNKVSRNGEANGGAARAAGGFPLAGGGIRPGESTSGATRPSVSAQPRAIGDVLARVKALGLISPGAARG